MAHQNKNSNKSLSNARILIGGPRQTSNLCTNKFNTVLKIILYT